MHQITSQTCERHRLPHQQDALCVDVAACSANINAKPVSFKACIDIEMPRSCHRPIGRFEYERAIDDARRSDGERLAWMRAEEEEASSREVSGEDLSRRVIPGCDFALAVASRRASCSGFNDRK